MCGVRCAFAPPASAGRRRVSGADIARVACERLRQRIESPDFSQVGRLTVNIGFTGIGADDTPGAAFERADQAVYQAIYQAIYQATYQAKQTGRNRTVADTELTLRAPAVATAPRGELAFF